MVHILAAVILIAICFLAGLATRTTVAKNLVIALETNVLDKIPAYELLKAKTQSALAPEEAEGLRPAITRFDDSWQLVFEIERFTDGKAAVFDHVFDTSAFRLELVENANGSEGIRWHGMVDGEAQTFSVDPFTSFWRRFGIGFMGLLPIESQL